MILSSITYVFFAKLIDILQTFFGFILAGIMTIFNHTLMMSVGFYNAPVVDAGWTVMRDFANMFFIVTLIIMAFATIFEVSKYDFKSMIAKFLIAAVMLNFSLTLSRLFLHFSDVLSSVFLTALGNIADQLGQGLGVAKTIPDPNKISLLGSIFGGILQTGITGIWGLILTGIVIMSMGTATAFIFVRIPIIWYLLIFAPIAIMLNIFPGTKKNFDWWYDMMLGWGLYLPVFLFFLYFGMYFLSMQDEILAAVNIGNTSIPGDVTFQTIFTYFLAAFFILGGVKVAHSVSFIASSHVVDWSKKPGQWLAQRTGLAGAWQARKTQFQQEGLPGKLNYLYGGKQGQERMEARWGKLLGVKGMQGKGEKQFISNMESEIKEIKDKEALGQLEVNRDFVAATANESPTSARGAAMRSVLYERGMIGDAEFRKDMNEWIRTNPLLAENMLDKAQKGSFKNVNAATILDAASAQGAFAGFATTSAASNSRKKLYNALVGDKDIDGLDIAVSSMTVAQLDQAVDLFGGDNTNEAEKFKKAIAKKRPELVAQHNSVVKGTLVENEMWDLIKNKKAQDLAEMLDPTWGTGEFRTAVQRKMTELNTNNPPLPRGGTYFPPGSTIPTGYGPGTANPGMPAGLGLFFARINLPGGRYSKKATLGGGGAFRAELNKATLNSPTKNGIVVTL